MAWHLITSLLSLCSSLLSSIRASVHPPSSSSSSNNNSKKGHAFREDLERMMRTLERIKAMLYDAEWREIRERSVKLWLKELKRVAYDAEDVLSEYRYELTHVQVEARKTSEASGSHKSKQMECIVPVSGDMIERINKTRNRFDEIAKDCDALQLRESDGARLPNNRILRPPTGHMVDEASIFGRDVEVMEVVDLLLSEKEKPFSVISITGKGGLGKTTIAQLVYKNERVRPCFDLFGWVCVSQEFDVSRLIKATIESVSKMNCGVSELSPLQEELAKTVKGKRILLVLDDVWNEKQSLWELFSVTLKEAKLVRVLETTRNEKVANAMLTTTCFEPPYLLEDFCWQLFQRYSFGGASHTAPPYFVEMGRKIMRKCGGLPLAVKSIASLLRHEADEESWREILESELWESNPSNDIFPALQISYAHLPTHLKPCFFICSMYPKDYKLEKKNLIELWISHGYIESRGKRRNTDVGVEYYKELKERSFLDDFSDEFPEYCKLHDIIHDLARLNSENEHYSVDINQPLDIYERTILQEAYHLYATGFMGYVNHITQKSLKSLRTFSVDLRKCREASENQYCIKSREAMDLKSKQSAYYRVCPGNILMFNRTQFEVLRVLELKGDHLRAIDDSIAQLKHLSHLRINSHELEMLPESIGLLYNLQTFILNCSASPLEYLPESIGYLTNLQYLCIECCFVKKLPESLCVLSNLQRLVISSEFLEEVPSGIKKFCNLQDLEISTWRNEAFRDTPSELPGALGNRCKLKALKLRVFSVNYNIGCLSSLEEIFMDMISELPTALGNACKLRILKIGGCSVNYNPHGLKNFPAMRTMGACLRVRTIAWLKHMKDLEGKLIIEGLENMSNLVGAQHANLRSKCKIETLDLHWYNYSIHKYEHSDGWDKEELRIRLKKVPGNGRVVGGDVNFGLLECLQPHPHLNKLLLRGYPSATVPGWMGDPFSLQAIQEIRLEDCDGLQSLPFSNLHSLKHLQVKSCSGIRLLPLEQLPSQLEELRIDCCKQLELITGLRSLEMLAALEIDYCEDLKSITMEEQQLVESTEPFGNSSHETPRDGWQSTSSLKRLYIWNCPLLHALPHGLVQSRHCNVSIYGCGYLYNFFVAVK